MRTDNPGHIQTYQPMERPNHITFPIPVEEPKGWGREVVLINHPDYCAKLLCFTASGQSSLHYHDRKHETWYVLEGEIQLTWVDTATARSYTKVLKVGDMVDIPRLCPHQVLAQADTRIMEVSTPHYHDDSYRVVPGDSQQTVARA